MALGFRQRMTAGLGQQWGSPFTDDYGAILILFRLWPFYKNLIARGLALVAY
jgi:hypothetical protein